jgi:hypothetical protein
MERLSKYENQWFQNLDHLDLSNRVNTGHPKNGPIQKPDQFESQTNLCPDFKWLERFYFQSGFQMV